jgi:pyruvate kinase
MAQICAESEAHIDSEAQFRRILDRQKVPMDSIKESLASTAVRCAHKVGARLIISLARTGKLAQYIAKYRSPVPILMLILDEEGVEAAESVARRSLVYRGIVPVVVKTADHPPGNYREQMLEALNHAKAMGLVKTGDQVVGLHALGKDSVMKVLEVH